MEIKKLTYFFVNTYLIRGEKTVLFDAGAVLEPEALPGFLEENGVDPKEIDLIVISHAHWDHIQLLKAWKELTGAKIVCHKNTAEHLIAGKNSQFNFGAEAQAYPPYIEFMVTTAVNEFPPVTPDIVMGDEDFDLHPYGIQGKLIYTPGHADSSIALVMDDRSAFIGDSIVDLHAIQCLTEEYPEITPSLNWICHDKELLKKSARRLLAAADIFYSGHGGPFTREEIERLI